MSNSPAGGSPADSVPELRCIFELFSESPAGAERNAMLEHHCGGDPHLQIRSGLLDAAETLTEDEPDPLSKAVNRLSPTVEALGLNRAEEEGAEKVELDSHDSAHGKDSEALPKVSFGPYDIDHELGVGGMGLVYLAQQTEPVERQVALKVIKPGMDSR